MTPVFSARRRAEEFAALVEDPSTGGTDTRNADLLELVGALRSTPPAQARPEFVSDLRERLMAAADTALAPAAAATSREVERLTLPARKPSRDRRLAAAVGGLALVGATTSMAMAAQSALPGDVLYPVKRAIENAHADVALGDGEKGATLLQNASGRLEEATALSRGGDLGDTTAIADTLDAFAEQATAASDLLLADYTDTGHQASVDELRDFTAASLEQLTTLEPLVPDEARDELDHAAHVLIAIDAAAHQACPVCSGGITQIPNVFVPVASGLAAAADASAVTGSRGKPQHAPQGSTAHPQVPSVDANDLPPGSVLTQPGGTTPPSPTQTGGGTGDGQDPLTTLGQGLTGGVSQPTSNPSLPGVGDTLQGVGDAVGDTVDGVTGDLLNP